MGGNDKKDRTEDNGLVQRRWQVAIVHRDGEKRLYAKPAGVLW